MEDVEKWAEQFKKGFSNPFVLLSLSKTPNYPYGITKAVAEKTNGKFTIAGSNIYPILKKMEKMQLIVETQDQESDRKFYRLTSNGEVFLSSLKHVMKDFIEVIQILLND